MHRSVANTLWRLSALLLLAGMANLAPAAESGKPPATEAHASASFSRATVLTLARNLAQKPYQAPADALPPELADISYDEYRDIRFAPARALWAHENLPYQVQFFPLGLFFKNPVQVYEVENGKARHIPYSPDLFTTGDVMNKPLPRKDIGFSGFRLHAPINSDYFDELAVFQGASYFRSLGRHQSYGLSARGLALKTADPAGEEFPAFRTFWIEKPSGDSNTITVDALLDSPSTTGAYRFTIRPGDNTVMDVEATLFPRVDLDKVGLAPATSMFMFSMNDRRHADDYRPQVHDSDGLLIENGKGERLWRPLANPKQLQVSAFADADPVGFGLMQRERDFARYEDLEAHYEKRPSLWIEPVGNWGKGAVTLVEIPSQSEANDNIVSYWNPQQVLKAGSEFSFAYRMIWGTQPASNAVRVVSTRSGRADIKKPTPNRLFVVDYAESLPPAEKLPGATVTASTGTIKNVVVQRNPTTKGYRVSFELDPDGSAVAELRLELKFADGREAETWVDRWVPDS
ncbi:glucan biosynthesis protein G [Microbulbifer sp. SAOS-129_SWC]|uniref:glucan biosynthesis protein G n=1 Tax=Microbulbifer sp. SAOS-129_SWC TaxID=3145235 RepID=UPI003217A2D1